MIKFETVNIAITINYSDSISLSTEDRRKLYNLYNRVILPSENKVRYFFNSIHSFHLAEFILAFNKIDYSTLKIE